MLATGLQMVLALTAVIAVMALLAKLARRGLAGGGRRPLLQVLTRQQLSKGCYLAVVRVGEGYQAIAVSPGGITQLAELDPAAVAPLLPAPRSAPGAAPGQQLGGWPGVGSFGKRWMAHVRELTVRRR